MDDPMIEICTLETTSTLGAPPPYNKLYTKDAVRKFLKDNALSSHIRVNAHPYMFQSATVFPK